MNDDQDRGTRLVHDWNGTIGYRTHINEETLRDGLQAPSARMPTPEQKAYLLSLMDRLGIEAACIGFPASSRKMAEDADYLVRHTQREGLKLQLAGAARTLIADIEPIVELSQKHGMAMGANLFLGSSPIRQHIEGWDLSQILDLTRKSVGFAAENGLVVCFATEDTTRSRPIELAAIYGTAVEAGAKRICLCDTVGQSVPKGVNMIVRYFRQTLGDDVAIDWHGHNDRGLALANALAAIEAGADRVHTTALGMGERAGNTPTELLLVNLRMDNGRAFDGTDLAEYGRAVVEMCGGHLPANYPLLGADVFRTSSGIHAAAIAKALDCGDTHLADIVYSSIPASMVGRAQEIEIGPMSGRANVRHWMRTTGLDIHFSAVELDEIEERILDSAKKHHECLGVEHLAQIVSGVEAKMATRPERSDA